jgi:hypothetical protein
MKYMSYILLWNGLLSQLTQMVNRSRQQKIMHQAAGFQLIVYKEPMHQVNH